MNSNHNNAMSSGFTLKEPIDIHGHVYFVTGASRGLGRAIALYLADKGAKVVVAAKTVEETDPRLPGTIHSVVREIVDAGGQALAVQLDVRSEQMIKDAVSKTVEVFGRLDGVINNAGALYMTDIESTRMKDFDLMHALNTRAIDLIIQESLPWLKQSPNARILNISPPIVLDPRWFVFGYTRSKYAMSMATMGYSERFKAYGIAVNSLWPETAVDTAAVRNKLGGDDTVHLSRKPEFVARAAYLVLTQPKDVTGQFFIDSQVVKAGGETDMSGYRVDETKPLLLDFFIGEPPKSAKEALARVVWPDANGGLATYDWENKENGEPPEKEVPVQTTAAVETTETVSVSTVTAVTNTPSNPKCMRGAEKAEESEIPFDYTAFALRLNQHVAHLTLNSPKRMNCFTREFFDELPLAIIQLQRLGARVMIITGEGENFSSGIDLSILADPGMLDVGSCYARARFLTLVETYQAAISSLEKAPFPVLVGVNGLCIGAALDLIAACDIRYATGSSRYAIAEIDVGLMADLGSLQRLPAKMEEGLVRLMAFSGWKIDASQALNCGLVAEVFAGSKGMLESLEALARQIASKAPKAVAATKRSLNYNSGHTTEQSLAECARLQLRNIEPEVVRSHVAKIVAGMKNAK